jgi:thioredoxin-related protein
MEPVIQALSEKYQEEVAFLVIDVEKSDDPSVEKLARDFQVQYIPTIILIDHQGQVLKQHVGAVAKEELTEEIEQMIKIKSP